MATQLTSLPAEMLQQISSYIEGPDLLSLRLTCKALSAAAFDAFATEFLQELDCYVLSLEALDRSENIVTSPGLGRAVRWVVFTLQHDITAFPDVARDAALRSLYGKQPPVAEILRVLKMLATTNCTVTMYLSAGLYELGMGYDLTGHDILESVSRSGCALTALHLNWATIPSLKTLVGDQPNGLEPALRELIDNLQSVRNVTSAPTQLKKLDIWFDGSFNHHVNPQFNGLAASILLGNRLKSLETLYLWHLRLEKKDLIDALTRCCETLVEVRIWSVTLLALEEQWTEVLTLIKSMPRLREASIVYCYQGDNDGDMIVLLDSGGGDGNERLEHLEIESYEHEKIQEVLEATLARGLVLDE